MLANQLGNVVGFICSATGSETLPRRHHLQYERPSVHPFREILHCYRETLAQALLCNVPSLSVYLQRQLNILLAYAALLVACAEHEVEAATMPINHKAGAMTLPGDNTLLPVYEVRWRQDSFLVVTTSIFLHVKVGRGRRRRGGQVRHDPTADPEDLPGRVRPNHRRQLPQTLGDRRKDMSAAW